MAMETRQTETPVWYGIEKRNAAKNSAERAPMQKRSNDYL
jgi:hypothetical protein